MYKAQLIHEVLPGKFPEMQEWFRKADEKRKKEDPNYKPFKRYITVFGSVHRVIVEIEMEKVPEDPFLYAESTAPAGADDFQNLIVPGRTELLLLREID